MTTKKPIPEPEPALALDEAAAEPAPPAPASQHAPDCDVNLTPADLVSRYATNTPRPCSCGLESAAAAEGEAP